MASAIATSTEAVKKKRRVTIWETFCDICGKKCGNHTTHTYADGTELHACMSFNESLAKRCTDELDERLRAESLAKHKAKQEQANSIEGQFDTLKDRVVAAGYNGKHTDEEVAEMRTEMACLSSQYFDLMGLKLE